MNFKISIHDTWKFQFMKFFGDFYNFVRLTVLIIVSVKNNIQHHIKYIHKIFYITVYKWNWKMEIYISQRNFYLGNMKLYYLLIILIIYSYFYISQRKFLFGKYEFYSLNFLGEKIIFPRAIFCSGKYKTIILT